MNDPLFNFGDFLRAISSYPWWQVLIELLIIGAVVYWVISFLQGHARGALLKGILVLLITIYVVVRLLAGRSASPASSSFTSSSWSPPGSRSSSSSSPSFAAR